MFDHIHNQIVNMIMILLMEEILQPPGIDKTL